MARMHTEGVAGRRAEREDMMKRPRLHALLTLACVLVACGTAPTAPPPNPELFKESNAWKGELPPDATTVTPDEFQRGIASGDLKLVSDASLAEQVAARQRQYEQDKAFLQALPEKSPYVAALLAEAQAAQGALGDVAAELPSGQVVVLNGLGTRLRDAVEARQTAQSAENALADYRRTYELLPPGVQGRVARPERLQGQSVGEVKSALSRLNTLLHDTPNLDRSRIETAGRVAPQATINPGNGADNNAPCAAPKALAASFWFPLKNFLSPIKDQGRRGTCWAFAAVAALDSREAVQNGAATDLSEQFFVNKVKEDWDSDDYVDGYQSEKALKLAADKGQALPPEAGWTYNPAPNRPEYKAGDSASYANSCSPYNGTCSDTSHQSRRVCTTVVFKFCGYQSVKFGGPGVRANRTIQAWQSGDNFDLERYRSLLAGGHALLASFTVYRGFMDDAASGGGYVTNYSDKKLDKDGKEVAGSYGGHAVLIVGFLDNTSIGANPLLPGVPPALGGGYFIVKNSWGCNTADAGYWYVPVEYVKKYFGRLSYLDFDNRRSDAWNREQATPGGAPVITIRTNPARADLRVPTDLSGWFRVSQPVVASVKLTVTTDRGENVYAGNWNVGSGSFGQNLNYTFATPGTRTVTLVARTGATETRASLTVNVVNTPPSLVLQGSGTAYQGENYALAALISDINESDASKLCANTVWAVDAPDTISGMGGCLQTVKFGASGSRTVRVMTRDSEGATAAQTLTLDVRPPSENPFPRILSAGVYSREIVGGAIKFCGDRAVPSGNTIDLREKGCNLSVTLPPPQRYFAKADVENPSGEALTYEWTLYASDTRGEMVLYGGNTPVFELFPYRNAIEVTNNCRVTLKVNAPDPARSKSLTVWMGRCTYYSIQLN